MKILAIFILLVSFPVFENSEEEILGYWKVHSFQAFDNIISSNNFKNAPPEVQEQMLETFNKVIEGSYFNFLQDTVFFSDYKESEIHEKSGMWYFNGDTIIINDLKKIKTYRFYKESLTKDELKLKLVYPNGDLSKNLLLLKRE
ncbi:lipocalin family protein [Belliella sp. DSM 107340]|uniref:Lipocalin family protein n=1 Tax=Belliella calami TaxID=2923436 RepID=A0ABS9UMG7_9BACT|nr:lipocalin family protein [Belliella calami]MCH7397791.1 lipocalin family protein [Belliella calami]